MVKPIPRGSVTTQLNSNLVARQSLASPTRTAEEMDAAETLLSAFGASSPNGVNGRNRAATVSDSNTSASNNDITTTTNGKKRKRATSVNVASLAADHENKERHEEEIRPIESPRATIPHEEQPERRRNMIPQMQAAIDSAATGAIASGDREERKSKPRNFDKVRFGKWLIKTWSVRSSNDNIHLTNNIICRYFSPYPEEEEASTSTANVRGSARGTGKGNGRGGHGSKRGTGRGRGRADGSLSPGDDSMLWVCERCFKYTRDGTMLELHSVRL